MDRSSGSRAKSRFRALALKSPVEILSDHCAERRHRTQMRELFCRIAIELDAKRGQVLFGFCTVVSGTKKKITLA